MPQLRIDFDYPNRNEVDVNISAIKAAMETLMTRLLDRTYVQGYIVEQDITYNVIEELSITLPWCQFIIVVNRLYTMMK